MSKEPARSSRRKAAGIAAAVLAGVMVGSGVAWAATTDNMFPTAYTLSYCFNQEVGGSGQACQTDDADVYYYMDSAGEYELEPRDRTIVVDMLANEYAPTDLARHYDSTPVFSGAGETDIIYQEGSTGLPSSADGSTWCNDASAADNEECDQQYIRIRGNDTYSPGLSCHETGHAVGLQHGNYSDPQLLMDDTRLGCLASPVGYFTGLGANNVENINATY
ncbi:hypothetical protein ACWD4J_10685 [Streptomyces sp. NPDC002577]